ncbi:MAG: hypothetical protein ACXVP1_08710, partial [Thermoleophilia bacterium]
HDDKPARRLEQAHDAGEHVRGEERRRVQRVAAPQPRQLVAEALVLGQVLQERRRSLPSPRPPRGAAADTPKAPAPDGTRVSQPIVP